MNKRHVYFSIGLIVAGAIVWSILNWAEEGKTGDIALVDSAIAQTTSEIENSNDQIYSSRVTAITQAVEKTEKAVVSINVMAVEKYLRHSPYNRQDPLWRMMFPELFRDQIVERQVESIGSGFIISSDGLVVSNAHVVQNAREIVITMSDGEARKAKIIGMDEVSDVALLKIEGDKFPFIEMGNSENVIIGEWAIAMGNPFGLFAINNKPTVTVGVISAKDRDFGYLEDANKVYQDMLQTDAAINSGNSGGPLIDALGRVIGMNTFIYTGNSNSQGFVGIGFAIPINRVKKIVDELQTDGQVNRHFFTGIEYKEISTYWAKRLNIGDKPLVVITYVENKSPAAIAGAKTGDVILNVNGKDIAIEKDIIAAVYEADLKVGDQMVLTLRRDGKKIKVKFKLIAMEKK